ncbi:toprim domain-containing protein [Xanthomonas perforans]|nr:toprim domain-containing protein [Xanthomonas perforans]KLC44572.1 hypothetical protein XP1712_15650 [Xanthomonas perforans]MBZ2413685.1 toprim domain-containing protein [Xanthomonas perforans]MBZ2422079.1 toprim domain-containing protein [Xanthomonas perforans]MBZ2426463.1 toprim domain-containing protein [Xanthomonas perforans]MBZ2430919.1 toprim domain-containing protein [Xanthomonas perforans]
MNRIRTAEEEQEYRRKQQHETRLLNETLKGRWDQVLPGLIPGLDLAVERGHQHHITCPFHGGVNDFRIFQDFADTGGAICSCGKWTDGWALLMHARRCTFFEAKKMLVEALGGRFDASILPVRYVKAKDPDEVARKDAFNKKIVQQIWGDALPLTDDRSAPVRRWFYNRQLHEVRGPLNVLRCHPALEYFTERNVTHTGPAMVAMMTDINGRTCGLHRTWITNDGRKANVESVRRLTSSISTHPIEGSAVKFDTEPHPVLMIGEGIESSLAARAIAGYPTWSALNQNQMTKVEVPDYVQAVIVWADRDHNGVGQTAAAELVARLRKAGKKAVCVIPPFAPAPGEKTVDWNDVLRSLGLEEARKLPIVLQVLEPLRASLN